MKARYFSDERICGQENDKNMSFTMCYTMVQLNSLNLYTNMLKNNSANDARNKTNEQKNKASLHLPFITQSRENRMISVLVKRAMC
jgi:hypothetical protein